jgi:hypothetical protein
LDIESIPYNQLANYMNLLGSGVYTISAEMHGQQHLPYMHTPPSGASYMMRPNEETKIQQGDAWIHYATENRQQQVSLYLLRQQVMNEF